MHCLIHYNAAEREHYLERKINSLNVFFFPNKCEYEYRFPFVFS